MLEDHEKLIDALAKNDLQLLRTVADEHRQGQGVPNALLPFLGNEGEAADEIGETEGAV